MYWSKDQTEISCILSKNSLPRSVKVKVVICNGSEADLGNIYYETKGELSNRAAWHHLTLFLKKFFLRLYPYFKVLRGIMGLLPKATQHRVNINCRDVIYSKSHLDSNSVWKWKWRKDTEWISGWWRHNRILRDKSGVYVNLWV